MARIVLCAFFFFALRAGVAQQNPTIKSYAALIEPEQLKDNLSILASDAMEGRYTGSRGQKMAAAFIANYFEEVGLEPIVNESYYQSVPFFSIQQENVFVEAGSARFENFVDLFYSGKGETGSIVSTEIIYIGRGRDEDLAQVNIKDKAALILADNLAASSIQELDVRSIMIKEKGAAYIFVVSGSLPSEFEQTMARAKSRYARGSISLVNPLEKAGLDGVIYLNSKSVETIFNSPIEKLKSLASTQPLKNPLKKIQPAAIRFQVSRQVKPFRSENVMGYLPGTDKKEEVVVITSHYDHLGKKAGMEGDIINNGADDDGSGTVALMQLARAFVSAKQMGSALRRSVLFVAFTGEEQGKLGSEYYINNPVLSLANTVVNLNMDMIGRVDEAHKDNKNYIYIIGADKLSSELHEINERMNSIYTQLAFDYTYNREDHPDRFYFRSDHWNFAKNGVPIIFYFSGSHEDYHKVTDEIGKIDFDLLATRTRCIFYTAREVANRDERLKIDKK